VRLRLQRPRPASTARRGGTNQLAARFCQTRLVKRLGFAALLLVAFALGIGAALLVADGDDDDREAETVAVEEAETVRLRLTEFDIDPERVRVREGVIEFVARNAGEEDHALAIETSEGEIARTRRIPAGESAALKLDLRPGTYDFYDPLADHAERGMAGRIRVRRRARTVTETQRKERTEVREETEPRTVTETEERTVTETDERTVTRTQTVPRREGR
jgi:uncharacterized cupredoxin-like copper-binding protein